MPTVKMLREEVSLAKARLAAAREVVAVEKRLIAEATAALKMEVDYNRHTKEALKADKATAREAKRQAAIAKAEARLQRLLAKKVPAVGAKALKANRKPGRAYTVQAAESTMMAA